MEQNSANNSKDISRTIRVAKYTAISSLSGALITAVYESTRRANPHPIPPGDTPAASLRPRLPVLVSLAGFNSGAISLAFFTTREFFVTPFLQSTQTTIFSNSSVSKPLTWWNMRMHHVLDTFIASSFLGGAYNVLKRGPAGIVPGAITASLVCTLFQFAVNETQVVRLKYIMKSTQLQTNTDTEATSTTWSTIGMRLLNSIGIRKLTDEEYNASLERKKNIRSMQPEDRTIAKDTVTRQ